MSYQGLEAILSGLRAGLARHPALEVLAEEPFYPLKDSGLAHWHVRLGSTKRLARIPKHSQMRLSPDANLLYQATCFDRAQASGHSPRLQGTLPPAPDLPMGALVVDWVGGRPARFPQDLDVVVEALAAIHALPLPAAGARPPLASPRDNLAAMLTEIRSQAKHLDAAGLDPDLRHLLEEELEWARGLVAGTSRPPRSLIAFDAHPGNFLIRPNGSAILVDLEKARYAPPGFDLAHATLYTSTTWDVESQAVLDHGQIARAIASWVDLVDPVFARGMRGWFLPLRRLMWLWSISWCAKWRVLSDKPPRSLEGAEGSAEDWSAARSQAALIAHVKDRVDHYLEPATVDFVRREWCDPASPLRDL